MGLTLLGGLGPDAVSWAPRPLHVQFLCWTEPCESACRPAAKPFCPWPAWEQPGLGVLAKRCS